MVQKETVTSDRAEALSPCLSQALAEWETSIRAACGTLSRMPANMMDSITVTGTPRCSENEAVLLQRLSLQVAEEHDLRADTELESGSFTVRFHRRYGR